MFLHEHLTLQHLRLQPSEKWLVEPDTMWFVFANGGEGQYVSRSVTHRLLPGDLLIHSPNCDSEIAARNGGEFAFGCFSAQFEDLFPLFGSREISQLHNVSEVLKTSQLHSAASPLARECHRLIGAVPPQLNLEHRAQLLRVVAAIFTVEFTMVPPHLPGFVRVEDHLLQVLEKLTTHELMTSSVSELAVKFGCSKRHLSRLFHLHFGFSVAAMKMEMRLLKAVSMLRDPDVKIINVAEQCGFNYLGLFNACFKRRFGVTPSQRRKLMTETQGPSDHRLFHAPLCPFQFHGLCSFAGKPDNAPPPQAVTAAIQQARPVRFEIPASFPGAGQPPERDFAQRKVATLPKPPATPLLRAGRGAPARPT